MNKQEAINTMARYVPSDLRKQVIDALGNPEWMKVLQEKLEDMGVEVDIKHFSGDNSYPTAYTLICGMVKTNGQPTLDLAMIALIGKLLTAECPYCHMGAGSIHEEPTLVPCSACGGAHYTGQRCPLSPS